MENNNRYNHLNEYLKSKYGERTLKICIDGGFTCPNRDGRFGTGGCIYCSERGSGDHIRSSISISDQISSFLNSYRGARAMSFIAYFQNYTGTYDSLDNLKKKYDEAVDYFFTRGFSNMAENNLDNTSPAPNLRVLAVATRPDCIDENICKLLASYKDKVDVWIELGLQTSDDEIAKTINRGYKSSVYTEAVSLLRQYGIDVITHIMIGLPGESLDHLGKTVDFINKHDIQGLKIHSTYVVKNTALEKKYLQGNYTPLLLDDYIEKACYVLTHIKPDIIIHKISGDAPKDSLVAPEWNSHKKWIMNGIDKYMREHDLSQGMYFSN